MGESSVWQALEKLPTLHVLTNLQTRIEHAGQCMLGNTAVLNTIMKVRLKVGLACDFAQVSLPFVQVRPFLRASVASLVQAAAATGVVYLLCRDEMHQEFGSVLLVALHFLSLVAYRVFECTPPA